MALRKAVSWSSRGEGLTQADSRSRDLGEVDSLLGRCRFLSPCQVPEMMYPLAVGTNISVGKLQLRQAQGFPQVPQQSWDFPPRPI